MKTTSTGLRTHRIAISSLFFLFGFLFATWASRIPAIQQRLHLSETVLGAVLLAMPVGSFLTLPFSGYLATRIGSRKVIRFATLLYCIVLTGIGLSASIWQLTLCLFLFGSIGNLVNISINTQAIALEALYQKIIMSSFHGMWSVAGLFAAFLGTYMMGKSVPVPYHFGGVAVAGAILFLSCFPFLVHEELKPGSRRKLFTKPEKTFWGLGLIAFCSMICQGAMFDWSGVYYEKVVAAEKAYVGVGYTAFILSMTTMRFLTDWITHHLGFKKVIIWCGLLTVAGLLLAIAFPYLWPATAGLLLVGAGVSATVPLVYSAAGKSGLLPPPVAIAAVSSIGMIGLLVGPPLIGFIAGLSSLKISFAILSLFGMAITVIALFRRRDAEQMPVPSSPGESAG